MFFDNWLGLARVLVVGTCAYAALVFMLRVAGKRTLSKMNAFDLVVTVALGSTLASVITSNDVALAEGLAALALLIALQVGVAFCASRIQRVNGAIKSEPRLLLRDGQPLRQAMKEERVTEDELKSAAREQGQASLDDVEAIILESSGEMSVIPRAASRAA